MQNSTTKIFLTIALLVYSTMIHAQTQKGADIDGEAAGDNSGFSVSMPDASTLAIGAWLNDATGTNAGQVRVYRWTGSAWTQKGTDIDGEAAGDYSGMRVSMPDSNTLAVAARDNDGSALDAGHVRIYEWTGSAWSQKGTDIDGEAAYDHSGSSISMPDPNTIAVGAEENDATGTDAGHVRVYRWTGSAWSKKGIDIDGEAAYDHSGVSVSMPDSNTLAIGAYLNSGTGTRAGHVRVYEWIGSAWSQKGIDIDGEAINDRSGSSLCMSDANTLAVAATENDGSGAAAGHVRVYKWTGSVWSQKGADIDGETAGDYSGSSVSMPDSNILVISAASNSGGGLNAGHARVYEWTGSAWSQKGADIDGEAVGDYSGVSASMPGANTFAIGAYLNDGSGTDAGHVRVYCFGSTSSISPTACNNYVSPSGIYVWTSSGTYTDTISNAAGCDSIMTINLTINIVDTSVIQAGNSLTSNESGATYQWLNCPDNTPITGATNQSYTATSSGSYAVVVSSGGCSDTSACYSISGVGIIENDFGNALHIYPNPTDGDFLIDLGDHYRSAIIKITDLNGKLIKSKQFNEAQTFQLKLTEPAGFYLLTIEAADRKALIRLVKE